MSRKWLFAVVAVLTTVVCSTQVVYAQSFGQTPSILVSVSGDPADGHPNRTSQPAVSSVPSSKTGAQKPQTLELHLPEAKIDLSKGKRGSIDSIAFEPWAPVRGSLGVKVEVTW
jgi:hypothetical protein